MTSTGKGWVIFIGALGMMLTLMAQDIGNLNTWNDANSPVFIGKMAAHLGSVIAAFMAGKMIPTE